MIINSEISVSDFNKEKKLIRNGERYIIVNNAMVDIITALLNSKTINEAYIKFKGNTNFTFSLKDFEKIVSEKILSQELLTSKDPNLTKIQSSYLRLRFQILTRTQAEWLAKYISPLFSPKIFWHLFTIAVIFNLINLFHNSLTNLKIESTILPMILFGLSTGIHELGHIAACVNKKVSTNGIGVGFYFLFPVAFSDISSIWKLKKQDRIVVNLAGIYCEYLYALLLQGISLLLNITSLQIISSLIIIKSLIQFNPFIRQDGYWLLSDISSQPNLIRNSRKAFTSFVKETLQLGNSQNKSYKKEFYSPFILIYGILNVLITTVFIIYMAIAYSDLLTNFPNHTYRILIAFSNGAVPFSLLSVKYIVHK